MRYIAASIGLLALFQIFADGHTIIDVDIYYESLCPDSIRFVGTQLVPNYPILKDHLNINFIPYGKASHWKSDPTGPWQFKCQHGPAECRGNKAQACAIRDIKKYIQKSKEQQQRLVDLVGCAMTSQNPETSVIQCASEIGLGDDSKNRIIVCKGNSQGDDLLVEHGNKTNDLQPSLSFVPTVVINGVYSKENQSKALGNFRKLICSLIPSDESPPVCKANN